jgi:hypothetical protein
MERQYNYTLAQLIDRLSIVTLKSIKIPEGKNDYEIEASKIMADLDSWINEQGIGKVIRMIQVNGIVNEMIWANESKARKGEDQDLRLLKLTHSLNRVRGQAMAVIANHYGDAVDLKSDYMDSELTKQFGYDFSEII